MHFLTDFIPIGIFFLAYKFYGIYVATAVAIVLSFLQVIFKRLRLKRFEPISLYTFLALSVLGGATLIFQNSIFLKWKPTVIYWAMGLAFAIIPWVHPETLVQKMFRQTVQLLPPQWSLLNRLWIIFFLLMGAANLYVAYTYSTDIWVNFKLFGTLGLTLVFLIAQGLFMAKCGRTAHTGSLDASLDSGRSESRKD
jgi:intracellular septation protein